MSKPMRHFFLCVEGTSFIDVDAESAEDAKEAARDIFNAGNCDSLHIDILSEEDPEE